MEENKQRRGFITKLLFGSASVFLYPFSGLGTKQQNSKNAMKSPVIQRVRPLGFQWETLDPFLFCVHHEDFFPKGNNELGPDPSHFSGRHMGQDFIVKDGFRMYHGTKVPGFPGHPHRGFETITVVRKGLVDHVDSTGAAGRYGNGDVQWMTAGKGVQHAEMFPLLNKDTDNPLELFQIWLNLPKKSKMVEPHFKMLWSEEVPKFSVKDTNGKEIAFVEVLVGKLNEASSKAAPPDSWAAVSDNHVGVFNIKIESGGTYTLPASVVGINRSLYFYEGSKLQIEGTEIKPYHAADVRSEEQISLVNSGNDVVKILVLQGRPISEPVVQHGPFVMNTREEIYQAFNDYQKTQFGGWPWPTYDHVHPADKGRFARHSDGRLEEKA